MVTKLPVAVMFPEAVKLVPVTVAPVNVPEAVIVVVVSPALKVGELLKVIVLLKVILGCTVKLIGPLTATDLKNTILLLTLSIPLVVTLALN